MAVSSFAEWDPFTDACDALEGRTTEYASGDDVGLGLGEDWDPFADHEMLELTGELAMESDDIEALEAWIEQARAAQLPREKIQTKVERLRDLKWRREDTRKRKVVKDRLDAAMRGSGWTQLREAIGDAARAGVAHPRQLREAASKLEGMRNAEAEFFRRKDIVDTARRDEDNLMIAEVASEKLWRKALVPSLELEVTDEERGALEWVLCRPRPSTMDVRLCFPNGEEEFVQVPWEANAAALLTAMVPMKSKHRIPENLALFSPNGAALVFNRPLCAQGVRSGSIVRVDDAVRGARLAAPVAAERSVELAVAQLPKGRGWAGGVVQQALAGLSLPVFGRAGATSYLAQYASLQQSCQHRRLPLAIQNLPAVPEVVVVEDDAIAQGSILDWMREYVREVIHGEGPRVSEAQSPDAVWQQWEQAVEAEEEAKLDDEYLTRFEVDDCWVHIYWPLSYAKPPLSELRAELRGHAEAAVVGWNAAVDQEVMELSLEACRLARAGYFLATGDRPPREGSMPGEPVKCSFLRIGPHAESREAGREVHKSLQAAGLGDSRALVVVSRTYQSKRIALSLDFFRGPVPRKAAAKDRPKPTLAIIPYCLEPQETVLQDCMHRKTDILTEAQLLVELDSDVLDANAAEALSQLLEAFPTPERPHWQGGIFRRPAPRKTAAGEEAWVEEGEESWEEDLE